MRYSELLNENVNCESVLFPLREKEQRQFLFLSWVWGWRRNVSPCRWIMMVVFYSCNPWLLNMIHYTVRQCSRYSNLNTLFATWFLENTFFPCWQNFSIQMMKLTFSSKKFHFKNYELIPRYSHSKYIHYIIFYDQNYLQQSTKKDWSTNLNVHNCQTK